MIYNIYPEKDATLYEQYPTKNTGLDELLEIRKDIIVNDNYNSRALLKFTDADISNYASASRYKLKMFNAFSEEIPLSYEVYFYACSQSWEMGVGMFDNDPVTTIGVSWNYLDSKKTGTTWSTYGGTYHTESVVSQSFNSSSADINIDVTDIVQLWRSSSFSNNGFLIKRSSTDEANNSDLGKLVFFSNETHTIYRPRLELAWDDYSWNTGSLNELTSSNDEIEIAIKRLKYKYNSGSKLKLYLDPRIKYPVRNYSSSYQDQETKYIESCSYAIYDSLTGESFIDFDNDYTKLNCDATGNYFNLWTGQFENKRKYKILFKLDNDEGITYFDNNYTFEVI